MVFTELPTSVLPPLYIHSFKNFEHWQSENARFKAIADEATAGNEEVLPGRSAHAAVRAIRRESGAGLDGEETKIMFSISEDRDSD